MSAQAIRVHPPAKFAPLADTAMIMGQTSVIIVLLASTRQQKRHLMVANAPIAQKASTAELMKKIGTAL
jgi:hypothetical protein